ncbi:MAG: alpha/beta hydrolase [Chloroflexota bacterium]|nr:alpha/beta hydrolase [Chloroflexota bacterium]
MTENVRDIRVSRMWVSDEGTGQPVVLCNGGPGCGDYLQPVASMMSDLARVIRFEPRGCGRSEPGGPYGLATSLADLDAIRESFGFERWIMGGHSAGAFLALAYCLEYHERVAGVLYLSGAGIQNDRQWHTAYQEGKEAGRELAIEEQFLPNREVNRIGNESARAFCREPRLLRRIADIDTPFLAVQGSDDIRPNWPVEQLVHLIPGARIQIIDGAGHNLWLTHPAEVREAMRPFVQAAVDATSDVH